MDIGPWIGDKNMFIGGYGLIQFLQSSQRDNDTSEGMGGIGGRAIYNNNRKKDCFFAREVSNFPSYTL